MKNLIKSFMFAVAMLLAVCVQAENKPETVAGTNPESATVVTTQPNDVKQTPCSITIWTTCGITANYYFPDVSVYGISCENLGAVLAHRLQALC